MIRGHFKYPPPFFSFFKAQGLLLPVATCSWSPPPLTWNFPPAQGLHAVDPVALAYFPDAHALHAAELAALYFPVPQLSHAAPPLEAA